MLEVNPLAIGLAIVVAFVASGVYYTILGDQLAEVSPTAASDERPPLWTYLAELGRTIVLVAVVAVLISLTGTATWTAGLILGLLLWVGFPVALWAGAVLHERTPVKLAGIHAGDWLIKLLGVATILGAWR